MMASGSESSETNLGEDELVTKRKSTAVIWKYFGFMKDDVLQTQVLCKTRRRVVASSRGNTTNLYSHLQHNHKDLYEEVQQASVSSKNANVMPSPASRSKQTSIQQSFASMTPYEKSSKCHKDITEAIARFLAKEMMPMNTVSRKGFVAMIGKTRPKVSNSIAELFFSSRHSTNVRRMPENC